MKFVIRFVFLLSDFILFFSCNGAYNNMDPDLIKYTDDIPVPFLYGASDGASLAGIYLTWKTLDIENTVYFYRSESSDGEYIKISLQVETNMAIDTTAVPGKKYFYKIKAFYFGLGESGFSNTDEGYRLGSPKDEYESDDLSSDAKEFDIDNEIQSRTLYPENDADWIKLYFEKDNYYNIEILSVENEKNNAKLSMILCDSNFEIKNQITEMQEYKINYFFVPESAFYYLCVYSKTTGDYRLNVYKKNISPVLEGDVYILKGISGNYTRLSWNPSLNADFYFVYRSLAADGIFEKINVYRNKNSLDKFDGTPNYYCYDKDVTSDLKYYYKVLAKNIYGEKYFTKIDYGFKKNIEADEYEVDDTLESSKNVDVGKTNFQSRSIFPSGDEDYIKFQAEKGKTYSFETFFEDSEIDNASVTLLNESGIILDSSGTKNSVSGLFKIRNWYSDIDRTLYLKVKISNSFVGNYKARAIYYKDDKNINDF